MKPIIIILIILRVKHYLSTPTSGFLINFEKGTTSGVSKNSWEKPYGENLIAGLEGKVDLFEEKFKKSKALCGSQLEENINRLKLMLKKVQICFDYKNLIGLQKKLNFGEFDEILKESEANNYEQIQFESIVFEILDRSLEHNLLEFSSREKVIFFRRKTLLLLANDIFSKWSAKPELNGLLHVLDPREQMLSERRLTHILKG
ncbi:hypothetical protein BY996DRAFT_6409118 [Phakopsora pachyrhizi]|nr:hypothetical protein BY996DRAFT_6409118 [Phakopsora pachyrhizi]